MAKKSNVLPFETASQTTPAVNAKPFVNVVLAAKGMWDHVLDLGLATPAHLRYQFAKAARKEAAKKLAAQGHSTREIAEITGANHSTIVRDLKEPTGANAPSPGANAPQTTRQLLSQSDQNDWRTPRKFLDAARAVMDGIDLDPATSIEANETVKAKKIYVQADNGLVQPWKGRVWLNPPYGGDARLFVDRLLKEYQVGNVTAACCLINSHPTETKWFQQLFDYTICFVAGRIDFGGPSRAVSSTSTHGSAVAYLGGEVDKFKAHFSQFGSVVKKA
jgi:ParB family chromosome partitioning protein